MTEPHPYHATPEELAAIDAALDEGGDQVIPETELPAFYRAEAAKLRHQAEAAETSEMRAFLLEAAARTERLAESAFQREGC